MFPLGVPLGLGAVGSPSQEAFGSYRAIQTLYWGCFGVPFLGVRP